MNLKKNQDFSKKLQILIYFFRKKYFLAIPEMSYSKWLISGPDDPSSGPWKFEFEIKS
jgi:hypothetical protein